MVYVYNWFYFRTSFESLHQTHCCDDACVRAYVRACECLGVRPCAWMCTCERAYVAQVRSCTFTAKETYQPKAATRSRLKHIHSLHHNLSHSQTELQARVSDGRSPERFRFQRRDAEAEPARQTENGVTSRDRPQREGSWDRIVAQLIHYWGAFVDSNSLSSHWGPPSLDASDISLRNEFRCTRWTNAFWGVIYEAKTDMVSETLGGVGVRWAGVGGY